MKHCLCASLLLSLALAAPSGAAEKKPAKPAGTPGTLPPTSPMLVVPPPGAPSTDGQTAGKLISSEMSGRDLAFFTNAAEAAREQAFFAGLLKQSASSEQIRKLAATLASAQDEENTFLGKLAAQKGLAVLLVPTPADRKAGKSMEKLSGSNFDKAAMDKMVAAGSEALAAYQDAAQSADPQIKKFAAQMLPLAEEKRHLVEKMTGAGSSAAGQRIRNGGVSEGVPVATAPATPQGNGAPGGPAQSKRALDATPAPTGKSTPPPISAGKQAAVPTPLPAALSLSIATPPGQGALPSLLPPIVPPKVPPTPAPAK